MSATAEYADFTTKLIETFRANAGTLPAGPFKGRDLLLLTTTGGRTGLPRTSPLAFSRDGDRYIVIASKGGAPTHPAWYLNLLANPIVRVEVGPETIQATATVAQGAQRRRLYDAHAALMPTFAEYEQRTDREIPVVILERLG
jgi:deazaflavin-dependent oxidoreductase (nitroreductase family)